MKIELLDEGYMELVESWGSDERFVEAARMSTNKGFLGWDSDAGLLAYLYNNKHSTPFEMGGLIVEIKAPIMVFREWHRHRTQSYNETSARYIPLPDENYIPTLERVMRGALTATSNKQAQSAGGLVLTEENAVRWLVHLVESYTHAQSVYDMGIRDGVPKELARLPVPVGRYSRMRASANVRNWLAFLTLRQDPAAQWEIRAYANAIGKVMEELFPRTWNLYELGRIREAEQKALHAALVSKIQEFGLDAVVNSLQGLKIAS